MDPSTFRRDPWLRTSGYHLITWSLVAFVIELRRANAAEGVAAFAVVLVGGAVLTSLTHERRVGKMAGVAGEPVYPATALLWNTTALLLVAGSLALFASRPALLFSYWMFVGGGGLFLWGRRAHFAWYAGIGASMIALGVVDCLTQSNAAWMALRLVVLALVLPAAGLATNYRYLWFRAASRAR